MPATGASQFEPAQQDINEFQEHSLLLFILAVCIGP